MDPFGFSERTARRLVKNMLQGERQTDPLAASNGRPPPFLVHRVRLLGDLSATEPTSGMIRIQREDGAGWVDTDVIITDVYAAGQLSATMIEGEEAWVVPQRGRWYTLDAAAGGTLIIGFQIESIEYDVITCRVTARPCGISVVPEEYDKRIELFDDVYQCLLNEDDAALLGRRGMACYMIMDEEEEAYPECKWQCMGLCCP